MQRGHRQQLSLVDAQLGHILVSPHVLSGALLDGGTWVKVENLDEWTVKGGVGEERVRVNEEEAFEDHSFSFSNDVLPQEAAREPEDLVLSLTFE